MTTTNSCESVRSEYIVLGEFSETEGPVVRLILTSSGVTLHQYPNWQSQCAGEYNTVPEGKSLEAWLGLPLDQFLLRLLSVEPLHWCKEWTATLQIPFTPKTPSNNNTTTPTPTSTLTATSSASSTHLMWRETTENSATAGFNPLSTFTSTPSSSFSSSSPSVIHVLCVYFSLLDLQARGYQRPLVLAYFTYDVQQLYTHLSSLRHILTTVAHRMRQENEQHCLRDLEHRLADLQHTQRVLFRKSDTTDTSVVNPGTVTSSTTTTSLLPPPSQTTLVPPTPNTTSEVLSNLKLLHRQLYEQRENVTDGESEGDKVDDEGEGDDEVYHSAEDTASGSDKERSTPSSVSSLDDEARQLYELTQSRLLKSYTPRVLKSLLCCTPVTLQGAPFHLRAIPDLLSTPETYHTIVEELRFVLRSIALSDFIYHLLEYEPFDFMPDVLTSRHCLLPTPSSLFVGRHLLLSFNLHATLCPPAMLPPSFLTVTRGSDPNLASFEDQVRYFEACLWSPTTRLQQSAIGQTLLLLLTLYPSTLQTLVFSLLKGRPVILHALDSLRDVVVRLVDALSFFVVGEGTVIPWLTSLLSSSSSSSTSETVVDGQHPLNSVPLNLYGAVSSSNILTLAYLTTRKIRLLGLSNHITIPPHLYHYVTVWHLPEGFLTEWNRPPKERTSRPPLPGHWTYGPPYSGTLLTTLFQTKKQWPDPFTFLAHLHSTLQDFVSRVCLVYHLLHLAPMRGKILQFFSPQSPRSPRSSTSSSTPQQIVSPPTSPNHSQSTLSRDRSPINSQPPTKVPMVSPSPLSYVTAPNRAFLESALPSVTDTSGVTRPTRSRSSQDLKAFYRRFNFVDNDIEIVEHMIETVKEQQMASVKGVTKRVIFRLDYSSNKKLFAR